MPDQAIFKTVGRLADESNLEVFAVGGYVRDKLFGKEIKDVDFVVVGDGPEFARKVARQLKAKGVVVFEKFGTARLDLPDHQLEFVGARRESYAENSRKPTVAQADLTADLSRRDFTINAMAMGLNRHNFGEIIDPFGGQTDLLRKIIHTPLDPEVTFNDDPLRILRAIRFATVLGFKIEKKTKAAISATRHRLSIVSQERITDELMKILAATKPSTGFLLMDETGLLEILLPEIVAMKGIEQIGVYHHKDVFDHTLKVVDNVAAVSDKLPLRFTALFHDIAKPRTKAFKEGQGWTFHGHDEIGARMLVGLCRRLKLPNDLLVYAQKLLRLHLRPIQVADEEVTDSAIRRMLVQGGEDLEDLLLLCRADITSGNPRRVQQHLANFDYVVQRLHEVEEKDKMRAFQSPVRGDEIMQVCGIPPGPQVGKLKKIIEEAILEGEIPNEHDAAYEYLLKIKDGVLTEGS